MTASTFTTAYAANLNTVLHGDCVEIMRGMTSETVDFVLTDPPYINRYATRDGRVIRNDNFVWVKPAHIFALASTVMVEIRGVSARRAQCPITWSSARA